MLRTRWLECLLLAAATHRIPHPLGAECQLPHRRESGQLQQDDATAKPTLPAYKQDELYAFELRPWTTPFCRALEPDAYHSCQDAWSASGPDAPIFADPVLHASPSGFLPHCEGATLQLRADIAALPEGSPAPRLLLTREGTSPTAPLPSCRVAEAWGLPPSLHRCCCLAELSNFIPCTAALPNCSPTPIYSCLLPAASPTPSGLIVCRRGLAQHRNLVCHCQERPGRMLSVAQAILLLFGLCCVMGVF